MVVHLVKKDFDLFLLLILLTGQPTEEVGSGRIVARPGHEVGWHQWGRSRRRAALRPTSWLPTIKSESASQRTKTWVADLPVRRM
jgi:hypothetical protein